jgi:hypothetical protein
MEDYKDKILNVLNGHEDDDIEIVYIDEVTIIKFKKFNLELKIDNTVDNWLKPIHYPKEYLSELIANDPIFIKSIRESKLKSLLGTSIVMDVSIKKSDGF